MSLMNYIRKNCPNCGNEFVVLENVEKKAVYCTLKCLLEFQYKLKENEVPSLLTA
jgi:transcription elongation factor Elf1